MFSVRNFRQYRTSSYLPESLEEAYRILHRFDKYCILSCLTCLSSIFASAMSFLRVIVDETSRSLMYVIIFFVTYDCCINAICVYFQFDFCNYYYNFLCKIIFEEKICNELCQWWVYKNVEKLQRVCRVFDGNLPKSVEIGCCDVCYCSVTKYICYFCCCRRKYKLIKQFASTNRLRLDTDHLNGKDSNDIGFSSAVDYELLDMKTSAV